jgi:hypothetical protein
MKTEQTSNKLAPLALHQFDGIQIARQPTFSLRLHFSQKNV